MENIIYGFDRHFKLSDIVMIRDAYLFSRQPTVGFYPDWFVGFDILFSGTGSYTYERSAELFLDHHSRYCVQLVHVPSGNVVKGVSVAETDGNKTSVVYKTYSVYDCINNELPEEHQSFDIWTLQHQIDDLVKIWKQYNNRQTQLSIPVEHKRPRDLKL